MTLYHGYKVKKAQSASGHSIAFRQEGDSLTLVSDEPVQEIEVALTYSGFSNQFYSNCEAALLPGYFPWYPMAGDHQIFVNLMSGKIGYNPYNRIDPAQFILEVDGASNIVTNLPKSVGKTFAGISDGLSLFTGNIVSCSESQVMSVLPLAYPSSQNAEMYISSLKASLADAFDAVENVYKLDISDAKAKPVIFASSDLARTFTTGAFAVFQDYILVAESFQTAGNIADYYMGTKIIRTDSKLCNLYRSYLVMPEGDSIIQQMLMQIEAIQADANATGETEREVVDLLEPLRLAVDRLGEQAVLDAINTYLFDTDVITDDQLFFANLIKEN